MKSIYLITAKLLILINFVYSSPFVYSSSFFEYGGLSKDIFPHFFLKNELIDSTVPSPELSTAFSSGYSPLDDRQVFNVTWRTESPLIESPSIVFCGEGIDVWELPEYKFEQTEIEKTSNDCVSLKFLLSNGDAHVYVLNVDSLRIENSYFVIEDSIVPMSFIEASFKQPAEWRKEKETSEKYLRLAIHPDLVNSGNTYVAEGLIAVLDSQNREPNRYIRQHGGGVSKSGKSSSGATGKSSSGATGKSSSGATGKSSSGATGKSSSGATGGDGGGWRPPNGSGNKDKLDILGAIIQLRALLESDEEERKKFDPAVCKDLRDALNAAVQNIKPTYSPSAVHEEPLYSEADLPARPRHRLPVRPRRHLPVRPRHHRPPPPPPPPPYQSAAHPKSPSAPVYAELDLKPQSTTLSSTENDVAYSTIEPSLIAPPSPIEAETETETEALYVQIKVEKHIHDQKK